FVGRPRTGASAGQGRTRCGRVSGEPLTGRLKRRLPSQQQESEPALNPLLKKSHRHRSFSQTSRRSPHRHPCPPFPNSGRNLGTPKTYCYVPLPTVGLSPPTCLRIVRFAVG